MQVIKLYAIAFIVFFIIDLIWLVFIAKDVYQKYIGYIMAPSPNWFAALLFYGLYIGGLLYFAIYPAVQAGDFKVALMNGALFGFFTYATYDLTNLATLKDWPIQITLIDLIWGTSLGASVSSLTYLITNLF